MQKLERKGLKHTAKAIKPRQKSLKGEENRRTAKTTRKQGTKWQLVYLNVNTPNGPIKRHRASNGIKNKTPVYTACRRLTSELKTHME